MSRWWPVARSALLFALGAGAFSLVFFIGGGSDAWDRTKDANGGLVVAFFCVAGAVMVVSTARWRVLIRTLLSGPGPPFSVLYVLVMMSRVVGLFVPRGASDLGIRVIGLRKHAKSSLGRATATVIIDNLMDIAIVGLFSLPGILFLTGKASAPLATALIGAVAFVSLAAAPIAIPFAARSPLVSGVARLTRLLPVGRSSPGASETPEWPDAIRHLGHSESTGIWSLTLLRSVLLPLQFVMIAEAFDLGISPWVIFAVWPVAQVTLVTGLTPGGLGIVDLGWLGLLVAAGIGTAEASTFVIVQRAGLTLAFLLFAAAALVWDSLVRRFAAAAAAQQSS